MILHRSNRLTLIAAESVLFTVLGPNSDGITLFLENASTLNYISYRFQESASNTDANFTDLEDAEGNFGTSGILSPEGKAMVSIRSTSPYIRLKASAPGGADLDYSLSQFGSNSSAYYTNGAQ